MTTQNGNGQQRDMMFGITIPRTIGISAVATAISTVIYIAWVVASINTKIDTSAPQIQQVNQDLQKLKSEIVTRTELATQMQAIQRDIDRTKDENRDLKQEVAELEKELRVLIRQGAKL